MTTTHAYAWELTCTRRGVQRFSIIIAGDYLLTQLTPTGNQRPRWQIERTTDPGTANQRAVTITEFVEHEYGGTLTAPPGRIIIHRSEYVNLIHGGTIPPALRARAYTYYHRNRTTPPQPTTT